MRSGWCARAAGANRWRDQGAAPTQLAASSSAASRSLNRRIGRLGLPAVLVGAGHRCVNGATPRFRDPDAAPRSALHIDHRDAADLLFSNIEGWPGAHSPAIKDWLVQHQLTAAAWYVANPSLTVVETRRLKRVGGPVDEFPDEIGS
jgi:hypothetical protein